MKANQPEAKPDPERGAAPLTPAAFLRRAIVFYCLWLGLAGPDLASLVIGLLATGAATWSSFHLIAQSPRRFSFVATARLLVRLVGQSFLAGLYTAQRALDPHLNIRPGFVTYRTRLPAGPARNTFMTIECLLPGSLPIESASDGTLLLHSLDIHRDISPGMAKDEALLQRAGGVENQP